MKPKGLLIALVLLAVLGGLTWWSNKSQADKSKTPADTTTKLLTIPDDQFQEIDVKKLTGETLAIRKDNGKWQVTAPKAMTADQDAAGSMASTLANLTADKVVEDKAGDLKAYGLETPTLDVQVKRKDGKTDHLLIGDDTPTGSGAYAKLANDARVVTVSAATKTSLDKRPDDLRDKRLMTFDSDKLSRVELASKGPAVEFGKNGQSEWQIVKPRPLRADGSAVDGLISKLKDAKMDLTEEDAAKKFAAATKVAVATVTDAGGTQTLEVRRDKDKNVYAKSSAVEGVYKTSADLANALEKGVDDFRNKKLFDFGFSDPNKVDFKGVSYTKNGDKWMSGSKTMDNTSVQNLIDKLRDLAAVKFVEKGGGQPAFEATVTSNSGKRVEKVVVTKLGDQYFAQREGEPSIYQLDGKAVEELMKAAADVKEAAPEPAKKK
uniref:DUF4340 domain-containing protein n=1 Tax=Solibacter usitatus (strain Ellin6076) TaxID=234267 RepID=Q01XY6_SOLUE